jgi:hypothetical protein
MSSREDASQPWRCDDTMGEATLRESIGMPPRSGHALHRVTGALPPRPSLVRPSRDGMSWWGSSLRLMPYPVPALHCPGRRVRPGRAATHDPPFSLRSVPADEVSSSPPMYFAHRPLLEAHPKHRTPDADPMASTAVRPG